MTELFTEFNISIGDRVAVGDHKSPSIQFKLNASNISHF
jgi:hypothetical protein